MTLFILLRIAILVALALTMGGNAHAQHVHQHDNMPWWTPLAPKTVGKPYCEHAKYHSWYLTKHGGWCCNGNDCQCAVVRKTALGWEAQTHENGPWVRADGATLIEYDETPDGAAHACVVPDFYGGYSIRCLFVGTGG